MQSWSSLLAARYVESGSRAVFVGLAVAAMLATLQRYLGVAATATAIAAVLLLSKDSWRRRLAMPCVLVLTALPMAVVAGSYITAVHASWTDHVRGELHLVLTISSGVVHELRSHARRT